MKITIDGSGSVVTVNNNESATTVCETIVKDLLSGSTRRKDVVVKNFVFVSV